ncbi:MAG: hypothetical protein WC780_10420 [Lentimicrobiaceae bacterium]|jgi:hypothetical protein
MKKLAILTLTALLTIVVLPTQAQVKKENAQIKETKKELKTERKALRKLEGKEVNSVAKQQFVESFGNIPNVKWKREVNFDEATFTKDGKTMKAFYDENAKLVGTTLHEKFTDLPAKAQKEIKTKYKDYTVDAVIFYHDNEANETDMILYGLQFDDANSYFVEITKAHKKTILQVDMAGYVTFFKNI